MRPISLQDKAKVIGKIVATHSKSLGKDQLRMILTAELTGDHLFLTTLIEDLCTLPADKLDFFIEEYLKSKTVHELFVKYGSQFPALALANDLTDVFSILFFSFFLFGSSNPGLSSGWKPGTHRSSWREF
jgi:hypothetical protein